MTKRKHLPVVQSDAVYEKNAAIRKEIADADRAELDAAITACGEGADAYGKHTIFDKLGLEPDRIIYCCRRDGGDWTPPMPDIAGVRILRQSAQVTTRGGVRYQANALTIENTRFAPDPVTRFPYRYDTGTVALTADYRPRTAEQLRAAAEARRTKALAEEEERLEEERRRKAAAPQLALFGCEP